MSTVSAGRLEGSRFDGAVFSSAGFHLRKNVAGTMSPTLPVFWVIYGTGS